MLNVNTQTMQKPFTAPALLLASYVKLHGLAIAFSSAFNAWRQDGSANTRLYYLNDHVRRDMGVTAYNIGHNPTESFWRD